MLTSKVKGNPGTSSGSCGCPPRDPSSSRRTAPGNPASSQKPWNASLPTQASKPRVFAPRPRSQQNRATSKRRPSKSLETDSLEEEQRSESHIQQNRATSKRRPSKSLETDSLEEEQRSESQVSRTPPEPVPEPSVPSSPSLSSGFSTMPSSHTTACSTPPMSRKHSKDVTSNDVVDTPNDLNQSAQDADGPKSFWKTDDSEPLAWANSLGGTLDDLCERTRALERELRAQCWEAPTEARLQSIEEDLQQPMSRHTSADDVIGPLFRRSESSLMPETTDSAVERELSSLQTSVGELKALVRQLGGELRGYNEIKRRENSCSPPPSQKGSVRTSTNQIVEPSPFAMVKLSNVLLAEPCLVRVCSQPALPAQPCAAPVMGFSSLGTVPSIGMPVAGVAPIAATVGTHSPQPSFRTSPAVSPPRRMSAGSLTPGMLMSGPPVCPRAVRSPCASPLRRTVGMAPSNSCTMNVRSMQPMAGTRQPTPVRLIRSPHRRPTL